MPPGARGGRSPRARGPVLAAAVAHAAGRPPRQGPDEGTRQPAHHGRGIQPAAVAPRVRRDHPGRDRRRVTGGGRSDTNQWEPNRCLAVCWRTAVTTVRIVHALRHNRPARAPDGSDVPDRRLHQRLIVLADTVPTRDGGHRAVPLWLRVYGYKELLSRLGQPA